MVVFRFKMTTTITVEDEVISQTGSEFVVEFDKENGDDSNIKKNGTLHVYMGDGNVLTPPEAIKVETLPANGKVAGIYE